MRRVEEIEEALRRLNKDTAGTFAAVLPAIEPRLGHSDLLAWAELSLEIAASGWHAWESSGAYLRVSVALIDEGGQERLLGHGRYGLGLCGYSYEPGYTYFNGLGDLMSADILEAVDPIERAGTLIRGQHQHASTLVADFFRAAFLVAGRHGPDEISHWNRVAVDMARLERSALAQFLALSKEVGAVSWAFVRELNATSTDASLSYLARLPDLEGKLDRASLDNLSPVVLKYAGGTEAIDAWLGTLLDAFPHLDKVQRRELISLFAEVPDVRLARHLTEQVEHLPMHRPEVVRTWVETGVRRAPLNFEAAAAFISLESSSSEELLEQLLGRVRFADCRRLFQLYGEAITGRKLRIEPVSGRVDHFRDLPGTDGTTIYLPEVAAEYQQAADNFRFYKVSLLHQLGYYEFGTFEVPLGERAFEDVRLARVLFQILEDARVDWRLERRYRGAATDIRRQKAETLSARRRQMPPTHRGRLLEAMLQYSLDGDSFDFVGPRGREVLPLLLEQMTRLATPDATVADTMTVLERCYALLLAEDGAENASDEAQEGEPEPMEASDVDGDQPEPVNFRGTLDPDQVVVDIEPLEADDVPEARADGEQMPSLDDTIEPERVDIEQFKKGDLQQQKGMILTDQEAPIAQAEDAEPDPDGEAEGEPGGEILEGMAELPIEDRVYVYDEWDFIIDDYRRHWCTLFEIRENDQKPEFVDETLSAFRDVALSVRRQLNMLKPELLRKVKGVIDGEDLDLERAVEYMVDRKSGRTPGERIYIQRQRKERDVSALFLLDMSASTDDRIPLPEDEQAEVATAAPSWDDDDFLATFYGRPEAVEEAPGRRIIDVEKQAVVLMAEALEDLGDSYSVCGFSGYGRERVDFFLCKDFNESYNYQVKGRIGGIKPCRSTRMGPAIRHAARNLIETESKVKALIIISDGYPQDFDYGKDRNSKDYGIRDTTKALAEARQQGIQTFCLTVDPSGHDYLREMCPDQQYMVIQEINQLPNELSKVYRSLTG